MDDISTAVRLEVRRRLKAAGLKQRHVAARLSVSPQHVSRMLTGKSGMSLEWAARILEVCGRELVVTTRGRASEESTVDDLTRLRDQIAEAIRGYDWDHGVSANPEVSDHQRGEADAVMAIVRFVTSGYAATTREYRERAEQVEAILRDLVDPDPCYFDHNGFCQAHGYSPPCAHAQATELLAAVDHPTDATKGS